MVWNIICVVVVLCVVFLSGCVMVKIKNVFLECYFE